MKMRNIIMAVIALVITASGCQKIDSADSNSTVKVKFTIADKPVLGDPGQTKAVKTAWAEGDLDRSVCSSWKSMTQRSLSRGI